ncbi:MAG: preprotein translocase subunit SecY [Candidatus Micrarchaeia archaeon]
MGLEVFEPIINVLPEVKPPLRAPPLREKLFWTATALILFFIMYHVYPIGVIRVSGHFEFLQMIMASKTGTIITAGIGPIVLASIFLQLFVGSKIIEMDLSDPRQKRIFTGTQKLLAIVLCFIEPAMYVISGYVRVYGMPDPLTGSVLYPPLLGSLHFTMAIVILQMALGSIILLYLDELVSRYGIGSGISLFIAAGVSLAIVQGTLSLLLPGAISQLKEGGANAVANALLSFLPLVFTLAVFAACAYAEGMKVEIPLAFERARGVGGRFPIKFLYVSNIPVILASALMLNIQLWGRMIASTQFYIGGVNIIDYIVRSDGNTIRDGFLYFITPSFPNPIIIGTTDSGFNSVKGYTTYLAMLSGTTPYTNIPELFHVITYAITMVILCVIFGWFWIDTTGMGPKDVAEQLKKSGLQIPGFRRDPRVIEKVLERYIPVITILGSAFVGILAVFADLTGALGTGTGVLLTVGLLFRMYEDLSAQHLFDLYPEFKNILS